MTPEELDAIKARLPRDWPDSMTSQIELDCTALIAEVEKLNDETGNLKASLDVVWKQVRHLEAALKEIQGTAHVQEVWYIAQAALEAK